MRFHMLRELKQDFNLFVKVPRGWLAALGIFLIPLDSTWLLPLDAVYRPVWLIPFVVIGMLRLVVHQHLSSTDVKVLLIAAITSFSSVIATVYFAYPDYNGLKKSLSVTIIGTLGFIGLNHFCLKLFSIYGPKKGVEIVASVVLFLSLFPIAVGLIQIPGELLNLSDLNRAISSIFSYRYTPGRIHLLSGEPSWAARYILFVLIFSVFIERQSVMPIRILLLVLLVFTGSALGFLTGVLLLASYFLIVTKSTKRISFRPAIAISFVALFAINYDVVLAFSPYAVDKIDRIYTLLSNLSLDTIMAIASIDGSVLARVINPIVAFDLALNHPLGIGGESFRFWVIDKVYGYGYSGTSSDDYLLGAGSTPKLLIAKLLAEYGIVVFSFLTLSFIAIWKRMPHPKFKFLLCSVLIMTLSDDSYLFYGLLVPICIATIISRRPFRMGYASGSRTLTIAPLKK